MSKLTEVVLTEPTFIHGVLEPAGKALHVDLSALGLSSVDDVVTPDKAAAKAPPVPLAPNLVKADGQSAALGTTVIAAVAPTGPTPTVPQAKLPDTVQQGETFIAPGNPETGEGASALAPEGGEIDERTGKPPRAKRAPAKAKTAAKAGSDAPPTGAGSALSD